MNRNVTISLDQAKKWIFNDSLRPLVLSVFSKEEILDSITCKDTNCVIIDSASENSFDDIHLHCLLSKLNNGYNKKPQQTGYFITSIEEETIGTHQTVTYPGIVYFKTDKEAERAIKIVKKLYL